MGGWIGGQGSIGGGGIVLPSNKTPTSIKSIRNWWSTQVASSLNAGAFSDGDAVNSSGWLDTLAGKLWVPQLGVAAPLIKEDGFNNRRTLFFPGDVARILVNEDGNSLYGPGGVRRTVYWVVRFSGTYISQFAYLGAFEIDGAGNDVIYGFSTFTGYNNFTFGGKAVGGKVPNISSPTFIQNRGMFLLGLTDDGLNVTPGSMKLYERGTQYATIAGTDDSDTAAKNVLGSWSTNGTDGFNGDICEMLIFDDALSASDLALLDNFFKVDQKAGYFVRDGATSSPIFAPGGAASATGFTPNLTNPRLSLANGQNDPGGLLKLGTELFVVYYVDSSGTTMEKWDYSNPASPVLLDTMPTVTAAAPYTITKGPGNLAFVPLYKSEQIAVMDLSKPLSTGACEVEILGGNGGGPSFVWSWGNYFVLANQFFPILYHYSTPGKASQIKFFGGLESTDFFTVSITSDGFLYILASGKPTVSDAHLYVYDMNLLGDIPLVAELSFTGQNFNAVWMEAVGNRLCFTDYANNKVHILDITNRNSPTEIAAFAVPTGPIQVGMFGKYIAVACQVAAVVDFWDISTGTIVPGDAPTHLGSIAASQNVLQSMCLDLPNKLLHITTAHPTGGEGVFSPNTIETWSLA